MPFLFIMAKKIFSGIQNNLLQNILSEVNDYFGDTFAWKKRLGKGGSGQVYLAENKGGRKIAVKIYREQNRCEQEKSDLESLRKKCTVKIPDVYFTSTVSGTDILAMEYIDGVNAWKNIRIYLAPKEKRKAFAESVAKGVYSILAVRESKFGDPKGELYDKWTDYYFPRAEKILEGMKEYSGKFAYRRIYRLMLFLWERRETIFAEKPPYSAFIHGDLCPMNMLADPRKMELKAFIDPFDAFYADPEYELFQLFCQSGDFLGLYEEYKTLFPVSVNVDKKSYFYAIFAEAEYFLSTGRMLWAVVLPLLTKKRRFIGKL